jgi:hypothetical protein
MKEIKTPQTVFNVELTKKEIEYIRDITQNYYGEKLEDEYPLEKTLRVSLFVGASRILGYNINDDGTLNRTSEVRT